MTYEHHGTTELDDNYARRRQLAVFVNLYY
jgi:hypothetical protein